MIVGPLELEFILEEPEVVGEGLVEAVLVNVGESEIETIALVLLVSELSKNWKVSEGIAEPVTVPRVVKVELATLDAEPEAVALELPQPEPLTVHAEVEPVAEADAVALSLALDNEEALPNTKPVALAP